MPKAPFHEVRSLLDSLNITAPENLDISVVANHLNVGIRFESLEKCAANIVGVGDNAIVTVDENTSEERKLFSIAHEIGHWIYDRGRGIYLCEKQDLSVPWNGRKKTNTIEHRANSFAAELLMHRPWFRSEAYNREMSFDTVEELRKKFKTSRTSTAIRLIELGSYLGMLALFDKSARRKWYCMSADFPDNFYPCRSAPLDSMVWQDIVHKNIIKTKIREVDGDLWIDHSTAFDFTVFEQAIRVQDNVLVLIWLTDDQQISEIIESTELAD
jgi:Zn-dependent peptidase ImmA (M78 family)